MFDDNSGVPWHKVQGRALGSSTHAALIETCPNVGPVLGFQFEKVNPLEFAELVWFGFEADLAKVYDAGRDDVSANVFGRGEGWLISAGFIPVVFHSVFDEGLVFFERALDRYAQHLL